MEQHLIFKAFRVFHIRIYPRMFVSVVMTAILYMCNTAVAESPLMEVAKDMSNAVPHCDAELDAPCRPLGGSYM